MSWNVNQTEAMDDDLGGEELLTLIFEEHRHLMVDYTSLKRKRFLGSGGAGDVHIASLDGTPDFLVVCKVLRMQDKDLNFFKRIARELHVWPKLSDAEFVLPLYRFSIHPETEYPILISKYMQKGDLRRFLKDNKDKDINFMAIIKGVASGLHYLHTKDIVHGDVKCKNILVSDDGKPLLTDFGLSHVLNPGNITITLVTDGDNPTGTANWMAFEILDYNATRSSYYTKASDVWSFGMTVYEIVLNKNPFYHENPRAVISIIQKHGLPVWPQDVWLHKEATYSPLLSVESIHRDVRGHVESLKAVAMKCWESNPQIRSTMSDIKASFL